MLAWSLAMCHFVGCWWVGPLFGTCLVPLCLLWRWLPASAKGPVASPVEPPSLGLIGDGARLPVPVCVARHAAMGAVVSWVEGLLHCAVVIALSLGLLKW